MQQALDVARDKPEGAGRNGGGAAGERGRLRRVLLLAAVLIGAMAAVHFSPVRAWLQDAERVRESLGLWFYPVAILASAALVSCGFPRLALCGLGGAILGFWPGLWLTQAGTLLGHYAVFLFVRWAGRDWAAHRWPRLRRWAELIQEQGIVGVILARQLPIHGTLVNVCLGLSRVKHRHFLIGTAIGIFPEAIPVTLAGAGVVKSSPKEIASYIGIAVVAFAAVSAAGIRPAPSRTPNTACAPALSQ